jgi:hypothetical protein
MGFFMRDALGCASLKIEQVDVGFQGGLIPFDGEHVVRVLLLDPIACRVHWGMQSIEGDDSSGDVQRCQGRFERGDFAPFAGDLDPI